MKNNTTVMIRKWSKASVLLVPILWLCSAASATADTLKLKDGTQVDGDVLSENDKSVVIEVSFAQGTIATQRTYAKNEIVEISRTPAKEKEKQKMEYWYGRVMAYQLNPKTSHAVEYYDSVITGIFKRYLSVFPESPHKSEINRLMAQWQAERDQVAANKVKRDGKWLNSTEAEQWTDDQKALGYLERSRALLGSQEFRLAWSQLGQSLALTKNPDVIKQVGKLQNDIYFKYVEYLLSQENWLKTQVDYQEKRVGRGEASASGIVDLGLIKPSGDPNPDVSTARQQRASVVDAVVQSQVARANEVLTQYKQRLAKVEDELQQLRQKKADFDAGLEVGGVKKVN